MAEAWNWYRAIFRVKLHVMRRGPIFCRWIASGNCSSLRTRITAWAADPRTNVLLIRRALDDILAGEPKSEWDAFSLKADYLDMIAELDKDWGPVQQGEEEDQIVHRRRATSASPWMDSLRRETIRLERAAAESSRTAARLCELASQCSGKRSAISQADRSRHVPNRETVLDGLSLFGQPGWSVCRPGVDAASLGGVVSRHSRRENSAVRLALAWHSCHRAPRVPRWSCYWRVSSTSATTEHPLLPTKCWWGHISMSFRPTGRPSSMTAAPRRFGKATRRLARKRADEGPRTRTPQTSRKSSVTKSVSWISLNQ